MNWWEPWVNQGYNVLDLVQERNQIGSDANLLSDEQFTGLLQYFVSGNPSDTSMLENIQGDAASYSPPENFTNLLLDADTSEFDIGAGFDINYMGGGGGLDWSPTDSPYYSDFGSGSASLSPEESYESPNFSGQVVDFSHMEQLGGGGFSADTGFDWSSVPDTVMENYQNMLSSGASSNDINRYLYSMGVNYQGIKELSDFEGGGGIGGTAAKQLFYPGQKTGFAGVGSGISGKPMQSTLDELLKTKS